MTVTTEWYRSVDPPPPVALTGQRRLRNLVTSWLPEPDVRDRIIVMQSRTTMPSPSIRGFRSRYHGLFSEFHSVLGALHYASTHGAAGVRVNFTSPLYVDSARGPNWWAYFFERDLMRIDGGGAPRDEVILDRIVTRYGRYGGFADVVQGETPYFYPMTFGLDRRRLHQYVEQFAAVRGPLRRAAADIAAARFEPDAFIIGVHYRGTDAVHHRWDALLRHYRSGRVPYAAYAGEVRRVIARVAPPRFQIFVATDEQPFVTFMRREFANRVVALDAPRSPGDGTAVHLDLSIPAGSKGESAILDALLLASTHYLVKGRSNLSDASLIFNPELPYSFRPDLPIPAPVAREDAPSAGG
jgi:hypothetical protein